MPSGNHFGWGICGKYLAKALFRLAHAKYITESFNAAEIGDELEGRFLEFILASKEDLERLKSPPASQNSKPVIQAIQGKDLKPWGPRVNSHPRIGYTFFEDNILLQEKLLLL